MAPKIPYLTQKLVARHRGTLPLVLACPHDGGESPPGVPVRSGDVPGCHFEKDADRQTHLIGVQLAERLLELCGQAPYVVLAEFHRRHIDANRSSRCAYEVPAAAPFYDEYHATLRTFVDEVRAEHGFGWLIDIHGCAPLAADPADVYLGTANGASVQRLLCTDALALFRHRSLRGLLTGAGYVLSPGAPGQPDPPPFAGGFTVQTYGSSHDDGIDALQVEIVESIRIEDTARAAFVEQLAQALAVLALDLGSCGRTAPQERGL